MNHPFSFFRTASATIRLRLFIFSICFWRYAFIIISYTHILLFYVIWMDIFVSPTSANRPPIDNSCQSHPVPQTTSPPVDWQTPLSKLIATAADSGNRLHKHIYLILLNIIKRVYAQKNSFERTTFIIIIIFFLHILYLHLL